MYHGKGFIQGGLSIGYGYGMVHDIFEVHKNIDFRMWGKEHISDNF